jgi:asparagine synthase (glutamine-hydrolysing)
MCGICGARVFDNNDFCITQPYLKKMTDIIAHRGPDSDGHWVSDDGKAGLAFRRLAIIDLSSKANQPMTNEDGSIWLVFNGEIYNHADVRAELEKSGRHTWKTDHSDTEMIVHAFEEWGIDCLHKFRGMFAMAIYDTRTCELWLVRDRLGIKPLYYSQHHGRITFASEIKALLQDPEQKRAVNEEAFYHYLSFLTTPAPQTLFDGIKKLPLGSYLHVYPNGRSEEVRWWDVWDYTKPLTGVSEDDIAHMLLDELRTSVKLRKIADVPAGVFLSGGIDSSTNAALFSEGETKPIKTFSIGYDADYASYPSELPYARRMAQTVGAEHHEKLLNADDLIDFLPKMVWLQDEPIADPVCVPVYYVSKMARENGVIVAQVGEGSDELFCGYDSWKRMVNLQRWDDLPVPDSLKHLGLRALETIGHEHRAYYEWLRRGANGQPVFWGGAEAFYESHKKRLLSPRLRNQFKGYSSWEALRPIYDRFQQKAWEKSALHWMTYLDLNLRLAELLLMRVDKMSMGVSLEGRVPFLDYKFVELALSIPTDIKTKNGELKHILKKAVRGLIPDELIDRKKQGFGVPVYEWFFGRLGQQARQTLSEFCDQTDFLDKTEVLKVLDGGNVHQAWYLLNFALWWKSYIGDGTTDISAPAPLQLSYA